MLFRQNKGAGVFNNGVKVTAIQSAVLCEKFQSVSVKRVVACGNLNGGKAVKLNRCHKHCRS